MKTTLEKLEAQLATCQKHHLESATIETDVLAAFIAAVAALEKIASFTTGYDDVAGVVCKIAQDAIRPLYADQQ